MNAKVKQGYEQLARKTGLHPDGDGCALYGQRGEYGVLVYPANPSYPFLLTVAVSAVRDSGPLTAEEAKRFKKEHAPVTGIAQNGYVITMSLKGMKNKESLGENLAAALNALTGFLLSCGYRNCCQTCGRNVKTAPRCIAGSYVQMCQECYAQLQQNQTVVQAQKRMKNENVAGGIVGAFLGTLAGVLCIIILSQLGYVAAFSGIVMAVCTLKGYELLGGKLTGKGVFLSAVMMLIMTFVGDRLDWAIAIARELDTDILTAYQVIPAFLEEQVIDEGAYWTNVVLLYFFLLVGAVPTVVSILKNQKKSVRIYSLEQE